MLSPAKVVRTSSGALNKFWCPPMRGGLNKDLKEGGKATLGCLAQGGEGQVRRLRVRCDQCPVRVGIWALRAPKEAKF